MTEVEYRRILDAVAEEVAKDPAAKRSADVPFVNAPPLAANDNGPAWPLLPFPEGWGGSC